MCCLFGILDYGHTLSQRQREQMLSILAAACEARGTDATGHRLQRCPGTADLQAPPAGAPDALPSAVGGPVSHGTYPHGHPGKCP